MALFTAEQINLLCVFDTSARNRLLADMKSSLPHIDEPELIELMEPVIEKLEKMSDEEFTGIGFYPADDTDEQE